MDSTIEDGEKDIKKDIHQLQKLYYTWEEGLHIHDCYSSLFSSLNQIELSPS